MSDDEDIRGDISSFPTPKSRSPRSKDPKATEALREICIAFDLEKLMYRYRPAYLEAELFAKRDGVARDLTLDELESEIHEVFPDVEVRKTFEGRIGIVLRTIRLRIPLSK